MAKLVFGMNESLDGYVDHQEFAPGPALFRHLIEQVRGLTGSVYGRRMYEVMRYWDEDHPQWSAEEHDFAAAWRSQPKWVVSRSLKSVGPNASSDLRRFAVAARNVEYISRLAEAGDLPAQAAHQLLPRCNVGAQMRGAGRKIAMMQVIRLDPAFDQRPH